MKTKQNLHTLKGIIIGIAVTLVVFSLVTGVSALARAVTATLIFNDIRIEIDGEEITPRNAAGEAVEPFIIDGTTYLPVRAIGDALGMTVDWDGARNTVILRSAARLPANVRVFEDSFVNRPLDQRWEREGSLTFEGEDGLRFLDSGSILTLSGFSIENSNNFTIEFEAMAPRWGHAFSLSLGTDGEGEWINTFMWHLDNLQFAGNNIANLGRPSNNIWYKIRFEVVNQQANIFVDDQLRASQMLDNVIRQQFRFQGHGPTHVGGGWPYHIRNFRLEVND